MAEDKSEYRIQLPTPEPRTGPPLTDEELARLLFDDIPPPEALALITPRDYTEAQLREAVESVTDRRVDWDERNMVAVQRLSSAISELVAMRARVAADAPVLAAARRLYADDLAYEVAKHRREEAGHLFATREVSLRDLLLVCAPPATYLCPEMECDAPLLGCNLEGVADCRECSRYRRAAPPTIGE